MQPAPFLPLYYLTVFGAMGLYLPFFPSWLVAQGFVGAKMSLLVALVPFLGFFAPPLLGMLADQWGWRGRLMTLTCSVAALALGGLALASYLVSPLPLLGALVPMVIFATFRGPIIGLADALLLEQAGDYGRIRLFGSIGFLLTAGGLGRWVDLSHPFQLPLMIAAIYAICCIISLKLPTSSARQRRPALADARHLITQPGYRWLLLCVFLGFLSHSSYDLCASLRLRDLGEGEGTIGLFWALGTFAEIFLMYFARGTIERHGPGRMLALAMFTHAARWAFLSQAESRLLILALQPLHALTFALMWLSLMAALKREVRERGMATAQGMLAAAVASGNTLGHWFWGLSYAHLGSEAVFLSATAVALCGTAAALGLERQATRGPLLSGAPE